MKIDGIIIKGIGGFYYVEAADGIIYECKARGVFRKEKITPLAGDKVEISVDENNKNSIDKIYERRNMFKRPPIANVDKLVIVSSVCDPRPNLLIIDRLTAVAVYKNVEPIIVFTKNDLQSADEYIEIYKNAGFKTFAVSNETGEGIGEVKAVIENGVCVISKKLGRGRHTTRHVELLKINNGYIADTPGFSSLDFETNDLIKKDELAFCFPDFSDFIDSCKFSTCAHVNDKGCRLIEAVNNGDVMRSRHESYVTMYNEVKDIKDWQL